MKLLLLGVLIAGAAVAQTYQTAQDSRSDDSPNANGILRTPAAQGTVTQAGASFGPDPVIGDQAEDTRNPASSDQNDRKMIREDIK
ncbi:MAG TPA: hypothetical protein VNJ01_14245 [Bacteriovoracaceae bacterium]|nr:hypothetical protein [Bacteriovoracaceae bacterium]